MKSFPITIMVSPTWHSFGGSLNDSDNAYGTLTIDPENQTVHVQGTTVFGSQLVEHEFSFSDIREIESRGTLLLTMRVSGSQEIILKDVRNLAEILRLFDGKVVDKTLEFVRQRIDDFEKRLGKT